MKEISLYIEFNETKLVDNILFFLGVCEELLPSLSYCEVIQSKGVKEYEANSFLDDRLITDLKRSKYGIELRDEENVLKKSITINLDTDTCSAVINFENEYYNKVELIKQIVKKILDNITIKWIRAQPNNTKKFFREHYRGNRRTPDFPGLYWLQYYGAEEFARQGGKAILDNPYIEAQLIKDGVFIQVGKSPYDIHTPEGEALMIKANAAMPPVVKD